MIQYLQSLLWWWQALVTMPSTSSDLKSESKRKSCPVFWYHCSDHAFGWIPFFFFECIFNRRIIALQCCAGFCYMTMWISSKHTYIPSFLSLSPNRHPTPLGHHRALSWAPCAVHPLPTSYLPYTRWCIHVSFTVSICPTLPFLCCVHKPILYVCISAPGGRGGGGRLVLDSCYSNSPSLVSGDVDPWRSLENSAWRVQLKVSRSDAHEK